MLFTSRRAKERLATAREVLSGLPSDAHVLVLAGSAEAAASLIRSVKRSTFGWQRLTFSRFAAVTAEPLLLERRLTVASALSLEAVWARVVFELHTAGALGRFSPIDDTPGLARALGRTVDELRLAGASAESVEVDLQTAWVAWRRQIEQLRLADRAEVLELATKELNARAAGAGPVVIAVDVALSHAREVELAAAVKRYAKSMTVVSPEADARSTSAWSRIVETAPSQPGQVEPVETDTSPSDLTNLQENLFKSTQTPFDRLPVTGGEGSATVELLSAPGESRECVEIARRILERARDGTPFERMAVLLRSPQSYRAPLEEALRRAGIPAHFATGTRRPDVAGRAMLALLACAHDGLSARRFAEYLSLAQVPKDDHGAPPPPWPEAERFVTPDADTDGLVEDKSPDAPPIDESIDDAARQDAEAPVVAGGLRAPWRWERLMVDAAVIGGTARWRRRLTGLKHQREHELAVQDTSDARREMLTRELGDLAALEAFALPLLDALAALPVESTWREWLEHLASLATRALKRPERVLGVLQELSPLGDIGPVTLSEVRTTLTPRLLELTERASKSASGQVYVAPVEAARGLAFDVVFVPGLAERLFPQKVREDPVLPDAARAELSLALETNDQRVAAERLALSLAVGAASRALVLSWPRIEAEHARPRVPSFYVLEVLQAVHGHLPSFETAQREAELSGGARLGWPAPANPAHAIDDTEYDLAVLDSVLRGRETREGRAHYLMVQNPILARALRSRYMRWSQARWTKADGLVLNGPLEALALQPHALSQRVYAPTALEKFSACPYRFILSAVHRLKPMRMPEAIEAIGPMEKGSLVHEVQFRFLSALRDEQHDVTTEALPALNTRLDATVDQVAASFHDTYAPAIDRVWRDGVDTTKADLREWLRRIAEDKVWRPWRFELSFGMPVTEQRDTASTPEPVALDAGVTLRGSIDLVEKSVRNEARATDYKTGKAKAAPGNVVGKGQKLQPALYALVLEKLLPGMAIDSSRLYYCTQTGGFQSVPTALNQRTRDAVSDVMKAISHSFEKGFFPAAPDRGECKWCDYQPICGPDEERRVAKKLASAHSRQELELLTKVRALP